MAEFSVVEHVLSDADTLPHLAWLYLKDESRWREIVDYNGLDYPYITSDNDFQKSTRASGYITLTRAQTTSSLLIKKGTKFGMGTFENPERFKVYETTEDVTINSGIATFNLYIYCTNGGTYGNTMTGSINLSLSPEYTGYFTKITNNEPFTNGKKLNVKLTGESILIPTELSSEGTSSFKTADEYLNKLGGEDLNLDRFGELNFDNYGDVESVHGLNNIINSVNHRIVTSQGELSRHIEYGTLLSELIGKPFPYIPKLMELYIKEAFLQEERVDSVNVVSLEQQGTSLLVQLEITLLNGSRTETVNVKVA